MDSLAIPTAMIGPEPVEAAGVTPAVSGAAASAVFTDILADILPTPDTAVTPADPALAAIPATPAPDADGLMVAALSAASAQAQKGVQASPENPAAGVQLIASAPVVTPVELTTQISPSPVGIPSVEPVIAPESAEKPEEINPVWEVVTQVTQNLEQGPKVAIPLEQIDVEAALPIPTPMPQAAAAPAPIPTSNIEAAAPLAAPVTDLEAAPTPVAVNPAPAPILVAPPAAATPQPAEITLFAEAPAPAPQLQVRVMAPAKMERVETATVTLLEPLDADETIRSLTQLVATPVADEPDVAQHDLPVEDAEQSVETVTPELVPVVVDPALVTMLTQIAANQPAATTQDDMMADERGTDDTPRSANAQVILARAQFIARQVQISQPAAAAPVAQMAAPVVRNIAQSEARAFVLPTSENVVPQFSAELSADAQAAQADAAAPRALLVGGKAPAPEMILRSDTELAPAPTGGHDIRDLAKFDVREIEISLANNNQAQTPPAPQPQPVTEQVAVAARGTIGEQVVTTSVSYTDDKSRAAANEVRMRTLERMVINAAREGSDTIKMQLYPPGLGQIVLRLSMEGNRLRLTGRTSSAEAVDALRDIENSLRDALATGGLQLTDFDVSDDNDQSGDHQRPRQDAKPTTGGSFETEAFAIDMNA